MQPRFIRTLTIASLACASAALACPPGSDESSGSFSTAPDQVVFMRGQPQTFTIAKAGGPAQGGRNSESSSNINVTDGDTQITIVSKITVTTDDQGNESRSETSDTKVFVNGKEVAQDRIKRVGNTLQVLDEHGGVMRTVQLPDMRFSSANPLGGTLRFGQALGQARALSGMGPVAVDVNVNAPKVMLGVTMQDADEALAEHLHLSPGDITVIGGVSDDSAASKAGLQKWDVIVSIDGQSPAGQSKIRDILRGKEPGQAVKLGIISGGQKRDVTATLEPFDPSKLGFVTVSGSPLGGGAAGGMTANANDPQQLEELMRQLQDQFNIDIDLGDLVAPYGAVSQPAPGGQLQPHPGQPGVYRFRVPSANAAPSDDDRLREMEARLQALQEMIRRLEQQLAAPRGNQPPPTPGPGGPGGGAGRPHA